MELKNINEDELKTSLCIEKLPKHVAIIMDGNRRWAAKRSLPRKDGHEAGIEATRASVEICVELGISILTLYAFSTENWKRPLGEVKTLMRLFHKWLREQTAEINEKNIRLKFIGDIDRMPKKIVNEINRSLDVTKNNTGLILNVALNYSGRREIIHAVKSIVADISMGNLRAEKINENIFSKYLYTDGLSDPDLIIRTSGEMRVSNFLLWQLSYSEFYFTDVLWPDFREKDFLLALIDYENRKRRFGYTGASLVKDYH